MCTDYLQIFGASRSQMVDWASHYIERGARIAFFKGQEIDDKGKTQPKPFWDALPKDAQGKTIFWVNASVEFVSHMLDLGADGMRVNACDLARSQALENLGLSLIRQGVRLAPIGANKKAYWKCIRPVVKTRQDGTTYESYNGALDAHWDAGPTTVDQIVWWIHCGAPALAALCGEMSDGLDIFDIDVRRFLHKFLEQDGVLEILTRHKVPVMMTGGEGYQLWFKVDGEVPGNTKYAWAPDPDAKEGRTVAIESRGPKRGYGLTVHSLHPKGTYYREIDLFGGSMNHIPTISVAELRILEAAARATCEAPRPKGTRPQMDMSGKYTSKSNKSSKASTPSTAEEPSEKGQKRIVFRHQEVEIKTSEATRYINQALDQARLSGAYADRRDVITVVNEVLDVARVLERYGYMRESADRYSHPDAYSGGGVSIKNNRSIHHSTNDRLHYDNELTGAHHPIGVYRTRTPFDVICAFSFDGNRGRAVKELAVKLGIAYQDRRNDAPIEPSLSPASRSEVPTEAVAFLTERSSAEAEPPEEPIAPQQAQPVAQKTGLGIEPLSQPLPEWGSKYDKFDWNVFKAQIVSKFDVAAYVEQEFEQPEYVIVDKERNVFYDKRSRVGGGPFQVVCFKMYGHTETHKHWNKILKAAAHFAGVQWPDFRQLGCTLNDVLAIAFREADNFYLIELEDGEYISDRLNYNDLAMGKVTHVIAGCGMGKTVAADAVTVKSFYTPMSRQAIAFSDSANERGAPSDVVVEGFMHDGSDSVFGTFDAAKKELELINREKNRLRLNGRTCFADEVQHICHDGYRKATALEPLLEAVSTYISEGGRVITLSGTPSPAYPGVLSYKGSDVIYVRRKNQAKHSLWLFRQSDPVEAILHLIEQGYTHITYSVDDKKKCEAVAAILSGKGHKTLPIHSDNKNEDFHNEYAGQDGSDGKWGDGVKAYVTTRATVDGFSIRIGNQEGVKVAEVFDMTLQYGSQMVNQRRHRVRDYPADVFVGMHDETLAGLGKGGHFNFQYELDQEMRLAKLELESAKAIRVAKVEILENDGRTPAEKINDIANRYIMRMFKGRVKFDENGELVYDEIAIVQKVTRMWVSTAHEVPDIMINELEAYGLEFKGVLDMTGQVEEAKGREQAIKSDKAQKRETELNDVQAFAEDMSLERAETIVKNGSVLVRNAKGEEKEKVRAKVKAAELIVQLVDKGLAENEARKQVKGLTSLRKDKIERVENRTELAKIRATPPELLKDADAKVQFLARLQDGQTFKLGETLTVPEFKLRVAETAEACGIPEIMVPLNHKERRKKKKEKRYNSERKVMILIKDIYVVSRTSKTIDGKEVSAYKIKKFIGLELGR